MACLVHWKRGEEAIPRLRGVSGGGEGVLVSRGRGLLRSPRATEWDVHGGGGARDGFARSPGYDIRLYELRWIDR